MRSALTSKTFRAQLPCALILLLIWSVVVAFLIHEGQQATDTRRKLVATTVKGVSEFAALKLKDVDRELLQLRADYLRTGKLPAHAAITAGLGHGSTSLIQVAITDASGAIVRSSLPAPISTEASLAQRPEFLALSRDSADRLHFSQLGQAQSPRPTPLELLRPMRGPGGEFLGAIVGTFAAVQLPQYFDAVGGFEADGALSVVTRTDGITRARFTKDKVTWGESLRASALWPALSTEVSGIQELPGAPGQPASIVAFHQIGAYPLVVTASAAVADWRTTGLATLVVVALLALGLSAAVLHQTRLKARAIARQEKVIAQQGQVIGQLELGFRREMQADEVKSALLNGVSHELRTPLNAILGFAELIRDDSADTKTHQYAKQIHTDGTRLQSVVDTLLDLAKSDSARMEVRLAPVNLTPLIRTLFDVHAINAGQKGLAMDLKCDLAPHLKAMVTTDKAMLRHVLNIVLHNAVQFTDQGSVRVSVAVREGELRVRVADTGGGIAAQPQPPGDSAPGRAGAPAAPAAPASGAGLPLARDMITMLGGAMTVSSAQGVGTEVEVCLPGVQIGID